MPTHRLAKCKSILSPDHCQIFCQNSEPASLITLGSQTIKHGAFHSSTYLCIYSSRDISSLEKYYRPFATYEC
jgi:hypothetical protein